MVPVELPKLLQKKNPEKASTLKREVLDIT